MQQASMARHSVLAVLLSMTLLGGCTLIDQRTFNPMAGAKPAPPLPPPGPAPAPPLVTIDFGRPNPDYTTALQQAVDQARSRKPDVQFDVVTVVPNTGTPENQVAAATALTADAREVARRIEANGVDDDHIHLLARAQIGVPTRRIEIYVR